MEQSCRLRAIDRTGRPHIFYPHDCPVRIWEDAFILANVPGCPQLLLNSVVRVMDHMDIGEGDVVEYRGQVYTVTYFRGFQLMGDNGVTIPSHLVSACRVLSVGTESRASIQFRTERSAFRLHAFLGVYEGKLVCSHDPQLVEPHELKISAGFVYQRQKLCYGDIVEGYPLMMWRGRPCINTPEGYIEIPSKTLLQEES